MSSEPLCKKISLIAAFIGIFLFGPILFYNMTWMGLLDDLTKKNHGGHVVSYCIGIFGFISSFAIYICYAFLYMISYLLYSLFVLITNCRDFENFHCAQALIEPALNGIIYNELFYKKPLLVQ